MDDRKRQRSRQDEEENDKELGSPKVQRPRQTKRRSGVSTSDNSNEPPFSEQSSSGEASDNSQATKGQAETSGDLNEALKISPLNAASSEVQSSARKEASDQQPSQSSGVDQGVAEPSRGGTAGEDREVETNIETEVEIEGAVEGSSEVEDASYPKCITCGIFLSEDKFLPDLSCYTCKVFSKYFTYEPARDARRYCYCCVADSVVMGIIRLLAVDGRSNQQSTAGGDLSLREERQVPHNFPSAAGATSGRQSTQFSSPSQLTDHTISPSPDMQIPEQHQLRNFPAPGNSALSTFDEVGSTIRPLADLQIEEGHQLRNFPSSSAASVLDEAGSTVRTFEDLQFPPAGSSIEQLLDEFGSTVRPFANLQINLHEFRQILDGFPEAPVKKKIKEECQASDTFQSSGETSASPQSTKGSSIGQFTNETLGSSADFQIQKQDQQRNVPAPGNSAASALDSAGSTVRLSADPQMEEGHQLRNVSAAGNSATSASAVSGNSSGYEHLGARPKVYDNQARSSAASSRTSRQDQARTEGRLGREQEVGDHGQTRRSIRQDQYEMSQRSRNMLNFLTSHDSSQTDQSSYPDPSINPSLFPTDTNAAGSDRNNPDMFSPLSSRANFRSSQFSQASQGIDPDIILQPLPPNFQPSQSNYLPISNQHSRSSRTSQPIDFEREGRARILQALPHPSERQESLPELYPRRMRCLGQMTLHRLDLALLQAGSSQGQSSRSGGEGDLSTDTSLLSINNLHQFPQANSRRHSSRAPIRRDCVASHPTEDIQIRESAMGRMNEASGFSRSPQSTPAPLTHTTRSVRARSESENRGARTDSYRSTQLSQANQQTDREEDPLTTAAVAAGGQESARLGSSYSNTNDDKMWQKCFRWCKDLILEYEDPADSSGSRESSVPPNISSTPSSSSLGLAPGGQQSSAGADKIRKRRMTSVECSSKSYASEMSYQSHKIRKTESLDSLPMTMGLNSYGRNPRHVSAAAGSARAASASLGAPSTSHFYPSSESRNEPVQANRSNSGQLTASTSRARASFDDPHLHTDLGDNQDLADRYESGCSDARLPLSNSVIDDVLEQANSEQNVDESMPSASRLSPGETQGRPGFPDLSQICLENDNSDPQEMEYLNSADPPATEIHSRRSDTGTALTDSDAFRLTNNSPQYDLLYRTQALNIEPSNIEQQDLQQHQQHQLQELTHLHQRQQQQLQRNQQLQQRQSELQRQLLQLQLQQEVRIQSEEEQDQIESQIAEQEQLLDATKRQITENEISIQQLTFPKNNSNNEKEAEATELKDSPKPPAAEEEKEKKKEEEEIKEEVEKEEEDNPLVDPQEKMKQEKQELAEQEREQQLIQLYKEQNLLQQLYRELNSELLRLRSQLLQLQRKYKLLVQEQQQQYSPVTPPPPPQPQPLAAHTAAKLPQQLMPLFLALSMQQRRLLFLLLPLHNNARTQIMLALPLRLRQRMLLLLILFSRYRERIWKQRQLPARPLLPGQQNQSDLGLPRLSHETTVQGSLSIGVQAAPGCSSSVVGQKNKQDALSQAPNLYAHQEEGASSTTTGDIAMSRSDLRAFWDAAVPYLIDLNHSISSTRIQNNLQREPMIPQRDGSGVYGSVSQFDLRAEMQSNLPTASTNLSMVNQNDDQIVPDIDIQDTLPATSTDGSVVYQHHGQIGPDVALHIVSGIVVNQSDDLIVSDGVPQGTLPACRGNVNVDHTPAGQIKSGSVPRDILPSATDNRSLVNQLHDLIISDGVPQGTLSASTLNANVENQPDDQSKPGVAAQGTLPTTTGSPGRSDPHPPPT